MANSVIQICGVLLCMVAAICTMVAVVMPDWRKNDPSGEVIEAVIRHQGIWIRCISFPTGLWQCDDYDSFFLGLPTQLQIARGLAVSSLVGIFFALILSIFGMECTRCMDGAKRTKSRVALIAGCFWIFSSLAIGIAVSYYAHQIVQDFAFAEALQSSSNNFLSDNQSQRFVFGSSLFLGWAAMAVGMIGGAIVMCGSCYVETDEDEYWNRGPVGKGVRRVRNSFRESFRSIRPRKYMTEDRDYV